MTRARSRRRRGSVRRVVVSGLTEASRALNKALEALQTRLPGTADVCTLRESVQRARDALAEADGLCEMLIDDRRF
jgi:hypothetical protein